MSGFLRGFGGRVERGRVLVAALGAPGQEGEAPDRPGAVPRHLRDAGFEVIVAGAVPSVLAVAAVARDEDVDAVVLAVGAGRHDAVGELMSALRDEDLSVPVVVATTGDGAAAPSSITAEVAVLSPDAGPAEVVGALERAISGAGDR
ncbi:hypothetical protein [Dermatobacter hominis]|uniref:hypothetical protein n=1 Tax=Dermatobacter hominis TaxID=2884263 RepID=UPI001D113006|nr:hypothetical protein [Dermatobacter hominis]UDY36331.1 hypothetical protein LH044_02060 [Dermatobacter hominis]